DPDDGQDELLGLIWTAGGGDQRSISPPFLSSTESATVRQGLLSAPGQDGPGPPSQGPSRFSWPGAVPLFPGELGSVASAVAALPGGRAGGRRFGFRGGGRARLRSFGRFRMRGRHRVFRVGRVFGMFRVLRVAW